MNIKINIPNIKNRFYRVPKVFYLPAAFVAVLVLVFSFRSLFSSAALFNSTSCNTGEYRNFIVSSNNPDMKLSIPELMGSFYEAFRSANYSMAISATAEERCTSPAGTWKRKDITTKTSFSIKGGNGAAYFNGYVGLRDYAMRLIPQKFGDIQIEAYLNDSNKGEITVSFENKNLESVSGNTDGGDLVVDGALLILDGVKKYKSVTVKNGGVITHSKGGTSDATKEGGKTGLVLDIGRGGLTLDGGSIDVSGQGFSGGNGGWCYKDSRNKFQPTALGGTGDGLGGGYTASTCLEGYGAGGSYGGLGGWHDSHSGSIYGISNAPVELGSGGGGGYAGWFDAGVTGGHGGGAIKIVSIGDITIKNDGKIAANGYNGHETEGAGAGGGSGGSIWIQTSGNIVYSTGTTVLEAKGGFPGISKAGFANRMTNGGGGGGGRISVESGNWEALKSDPSFASVAGSGYSDGYTSPGLPGTFLSEKGFVCRADPHLYQGTVGIRTQGQQGYHYSTVEILETCWDEYQLIGSEGGIY